jgi:hypothetical protein
MLAGVAGSMSSGCAAAAWVGRPRRGQGPTRELRDAEAVHHGVGKAQAPFTRAGSDKSQDRRSVSSGVRAGPGARDPRLCRRGS